jgi:hypothetical protein
LKKEDEEKNNEEKKIKRIREEGNVTRMRDIRYI